MNFINSPSALLLSLAMASSSAIAEEPTVIGCGNATVANISFQAEAWTSVDDHYNSACPLLNNRELRKLVDKFAVGAFFADPAIPYTCLSGIFTAGTIEIDGVPIDIDSENSYTESAQLVSAVSVSQGGFNLFATSVDNTLQSGEAITAVHLEAGDFIWDLLANDHFTVAGSVEDTENLTIIGSRGKDILSGRLTLRGQIISQIPLGITFEASGKFCVKSKK